MSSIRQFFFLPTLDIAIEPRKNIIRINQNWKYSWSHDFATTPWDDAEKIVFHENVKRIIWDQWSNHYVVRRIERNPANSNRNQYTEFRVQFHINWVHSEIFHWHVNVMKLLPGDHLRSYVLYNNRTMFIDTEDVTLHQRTPAQSQFPISHEFGHNLNNIGFNGDEYPMRFGNTRQSYFNFDLNSMMSLGNELRIRHISEIINYINSHNTHFTYRVEDVV